MNKAIIYSFRRCPYAMRARMAIAYSQISVEMREVFLKNKPIELISISPKATVPVLLLENGIVLEESLDIMYWAIAKNDPQNINIHDCTDLKTISLIKENDEDFKKHLDHYKYADRFPEYDQLYYRTQGEIFLKKLENLLTKHNYLNGENLSIVDYAIFPFIRQFAHVDKTWFDHSEYDHLRNWLNRFLNSKLFLLVMKKYPQWKLEDELVTFPY